MSPIYFVLLTVVSMVGGASFSTAIHAKSIDGNIHSRYCFVLGLGLMGLTIVVFVLMLKMMMYL